MITTILIVLVAVVVLIVIIAVLALHFLRADDSDTFDDIDGEPRTTRRSPADPPRELVEAAGGRRSRHPEPARAQAAREPWDKERQGRPDDRAATYRDSGPRAGAPDRRSGQSGGPRPAAASARSAKPAKAAGPDAKTNSWDSLSDVDYWAQLGTDKPQITPASSSPSARPNGTARRGPDAKPVGRTAPEGRAPQRSDSGPQNGPAPAGSLPVRPRPQSARAGAGPSAGRAADAGQTEQFDARAARAAGYASEPATQSLAALARLSGQQPATPPRPDAGPRPATSQRTGTSSGQRPNGQRPGPSRRAAQPPLSPAAQLSPPAGYSRTPVPLDDDPLTSPSFPAINTSDSRSYHARRSSGGHSGPQTGPQPAVGRTGGFAEPTAQYPVQPPVPQPQSAQPSPIANPYGSYVSAPQPSYQDVAGARREVPAYGTGYVNGQQPDAAWYGNAADGYLPTSGYGAADQPASGHRGNGHNGNGNGHNGNGYGVGGQQAVQGGYGAVDYQDLTYQGMGSPPSPSVPGGYAPQDQHVGQFDERAYVVPDAAYGQDGYQGYPGYGPGSR